MDVKVKELCILLCQVNATSTRWVVIVVVMVASPYRSSGDKERRRFVYKQKDITTKNSESVCADVAAIGMTVLKS